MRVLTSLSDTGSRQDREYKLVGWFGTDEMTVEHKQPTRLWISFSILLFLNDISQHSTHITATTALQR